MARHLMAVCVVCLLCADHLPCKEHFLSAAKNEINNNDAVRISGPAHVPSANNPINQNDFVYDKRKDKTKTHLRFKRHADHGQEHGEHEKHEEVKEIFLQKLFDEFANKSSKTMNVNGFEKMLQRLNLYQLITNETDKGSDSDGCMNGLEFVAQLTNTNSVKMEEYRDIMELHGPEKHSHDDHEHHDHSDSHLHHEEAESKTPKNVSSLLNEIKRTLFIDFDEMTSICPILLYQLVAKTSSEQAGCVGKELFKHVHNDAVERVMEDRATVWLYSTLAVLGVSLCGLLGVAVIPFMDKHYYHHVIQFLVALAVGTLCGDALLHLLPHAMMPTSTTEDQHTMMMMRGLAAVCGIAFFYFFERFLTMITEWRKKIQKRDKPSSRVRVICDPESVSLNGGVANEKQCKHKYSSYPYCYDEIAMDTKNDHHEHNHVEKAEGEVIVPHKRHSCPNHGEHGDHNKDHVIITPDVAKNLLTKPTNGNVCNNNGQTESRTVSTSMHSVDGVGEKSLGVTKPLMEDETYTIILREHESKHHGHSHTHGHVHSPPRSLSAVVWMVIMGDGLHNFTDGMAIGAAFSMNIAGGLSTAVAVFCHELPHELGDFAVLLKAGMSAKQAVYYNVLSSILSFFGMCIGIMIGDTPEASSWIFAAAAGMFIYIALVDMMPELTSSHKEESCMLSECFLQFLGMFTGFGTMLLIAMYEHDLKQIFSS